MKPFNQIKHSNQTLIRIIKRKKPILKLSKHLLKKVGFFMYKRCVILFGFFMLLFCMAFFSIDYLSDKETLYDAALNQQNYNLKIANIRGTIYDCRNIPLVNTEKKFIAAAVPCTESLTALTPVVSDDKKEELYKKCSKNTPFTIEVNSRVNSPYVKVFEVPIRYNGITPAAHIIGYISGDKKGLCGIEKIYDEYNAKRNGYINLIRVYIAEIIIKLLRKIQADESTLSAAQRELVAKITGYIENNYSIKIKTEELASTLFFNKNYISKLFKQSTGLSIHVFLREIRLKQACRLLKTTQRTITDIASDCGFSDMKTFYSVFKKYKGCTPKQFRENLL